MDKKLEYEKVHLDLIFFSTKDIVTASNNDVGQNFDKTAWDD